MWETTFWDHSPLHITISRPGPRPDKPILIKCLSPQSPIIDNVATRAKYIWAKGVLKENMNYNIDNIRQQSNDHLISKTDDSGDDIVTPFENNDADLMVEKKFTSVSHHTKSTRGEMTLKHLWEINKTQMAIKKPGEEPYDIDDGFSNIGSFKEFNMV